MNPANYSAISFPSLGIEVNPGRVLELGPLTIHYYGAIIALGLVLAVVYCCKRGDQFGLKEDDILDGVLWITPFAILCARIYYCVFSWEEYAADPISVLYIWNGGIAIYGGVIGAIIGMAVLCRVKKIKLTTVLDLILTVLSYGLMFWAIFRMLSRNTYKRYQENRKFCLFFDRLKDREHRYYDCPKCRQVVRVPRGKGKIAITCPRCREKFVKNT